MNERQPWDDWSFWFNPDDNEWAAACAALGEDECDNRRCEFHREFGDGSFDNE